jgi:hypothetical protein
VAACLFENLSRNAKHDNQTTAQSMNMVFANLSAISLSITRCLLLSIVLLCATQTARGDFDTPATKLTPPDSSIVSTFGMSAPLNDWLGVNVWSLYASQLDLSFSAVELPITLNEYITFTPAYTHTSIWQEEGERYDEEGLRLGLTLLYPAEHFTLESRSLYWRRFRDSAEDTDRFRERIKLTVPFTLAGIPMRAFVWDEFGYDADVDDWNLNRIAIGLGYTFAKRYNLEVFYIRQEMQGAPGLNGLGVSLWLKF